MGAAASVQSLKTALAQSSPDDVKTVLLSLDKKQREKIERCLASASSCHGTAALRIVQITDVYILDNFPHVRTLFLEKQAEFSAKYGPGAKTISVLTGDFLMPYILSTIDKGRGMMTMLNETPINYLIWGNHESDLPHQDLLAREREYKGCWVNTNMQSHESFADSKCQTDAAWIEVAAADGSFKRKVGLLGILTSCRPGSFNGAKIEDPWETMHKYKSKLEAEGADLIIPLCHLYEHQDERTAREFDFPIILSGHDHHTVDKVVEGTRILKPGSDAHNAIIIDITWDSVAADAPNIEVETVAVKNWPADQELKKKVDKAYMLIAHLRNTQLTVVPEKFRPLTSFNGRGTNGTMGSFLCSELRDALNLNAPGSCDCVLIKAGSCPRGDKAYGPEEQITLEVLNSEMTEGSDMYLYDMPGKVIKYGVREQWGGSPNAGWMQYDDGVVVDADGLVTDIGGKPLDEELIYKVGSASVLNRTSDGKTIGEFLIANPDSMPDPDSGIQAHALLIALWAKKIWDAIFKLMDKDGDMFITAEDLAMFDKDGDKALTRTDLIGALSHIGYKVHDSEMLFVDALLKAAGDKDDDGRASLAEINAASGASLS